MCYAVLSVHYIVFRLCYVFPGLGSVGYGECCIAANATHPPLYAAYSWLFCIPQINTTYPLGCTLCCCMMVMHQCFPQIAQCSLCWPMHCLVNVTYSLGCATCLWIHATLSLVYATHSLIYAMPSVLCTCCVLCATCLFVYSTLSLKMLHSLHCGLDSP